MWCSLIRYTPIIKTWLSYLQLKHSKRLGYSWWPSRSYYENEQNNRAYCHLSKFQCPSGNKTWSANRLRRQLMIIIAHPGELKIMEMNLIMQKFIKEFNRNIIWNNVLWHKSKGTWDILERKQWTWILASRRMGCWDRLMAQLTCKN
jgi:hypothetical protein